MVADRNLLFGTLALQFDYINEADFTASWADCAGQGQSVGACLVARNALTPEQQSSLDALVDALVRRDANAAAESLARLEPPRTPLKPPDVSAPTPPPVDAGGTLLQVLPPGGAAPLPRSASAARFQVVRPHARGGLGQVSVALDGELNREVALKEILGGRADDPDSRARFLLEAEVTGGLEHPGIVPVYSLGTYPDGRPFYAMRLIRGDSLHDAIQKFHAAGAAFDSLDFRQLLGRFVSVCQSIAYAHARGVLHRDLKPANVMLGKYGETLVVDWGLAKTTGRAGSVSDRTEANAERPLRPLSGGDRSATVDGQAVGTPAYMSPEQADGRLDLLEPVSDIYSLGATLYELLAGKRPFSAATVGDVLAKVKRGEFPPPHQHCPDVPRALEAVCLKAMALRPADRYASALDLAKDVERWLADEPVSAYPEPLGVRLRRWVRRHARLVTGVAAALAVGAGAFGLLALERERARQAVEAEQAQTAKERDAKEAARAAAVRRLEQVERANEILGTVFRDLDPKLEAREGKPLRALLGERLDKATAEIEGDAIGDSLAVARMQMTLGLSQLGLGYPEKAIRLLTAARATLAGQLGPDHPDTLFSMNILATGYLDAGRLGAALPLYEETLRRRKATLGPDHPDTLTTMSYLGVCYEAAGRHDTALPLKEETLRITKAKFGPDHPNTLKSMNNLANGYRHAGRLDAALQLYEESLKLLRTGLGPDHSVTLPSLNNLASGYLDAGRLGEALPLLEEAFQLSKAKLGPDHPDTLTSLNNLARGYQAAGRVGDALPLFEEALKLRKAKLAPGHPDIAWSMNNLAEGYSASGRHDRAISLFEEALKLRKAKLGPDHPDTLTSLNNLASGYHFVGRLGDALPLFEEALKLRKARLGPDHPDTLTSMTHLAVGYGTAGRLGEALPLFEEALKLRKARLGPDHPDTLASLHNLARGYQAAGRLGAAMPLFEEAARGIELRQYRDQFASPIIANTANFLEEFRRFDAAEAWRRKWLVVVRGRAGPEAPEYAAALALLGHNLLRQQRWADAEPLLRACLDIRAKTEPDAWATFGTQSLLGESLLGRGRLAIAEPLLHAGYDGLKQRAAKIPKASQVRLADAAGSLVRLYDALGKPDEAAKYLDEMWVWADTPTPAKP